MMKTKPIFLILGSLILVCGIGRSQELNPADWPSMVGYWKFQDTTNLLKATVGNDLMLIGNHTHTPGAYHGDTAVSIAIGSYYRCHHQIAPNGGGDSVNRYTLMFDFMVRNFNQWHTFHQTDSTNANDGECFIKPQMPGLKSTIGTATTGYTADSIEQDVWYRMVISVCLDSFYRYYLNGDLWHEGNLQSVDGRFALTPVLLFFADNNQEDDTIQIGSIAIFDSCLSSADIAVLGGLNPCIANPPVAELGPDIMVCQDQTVTLTVGAGYPVVAWSTGDTTSTLLLDTADLGIGSFNLSVVVQDVHGCLAYDSVMVTFIDCTSIEEPDDEEAYLLYPNPVEQALMIDLSAEEAHFELFTLSGQSVIIRHLTGRGVHYIDTDLLQEGVYIIRISTAGMVKSMKLIKVNK
jgi:hypothetical protein